MNCLGEEIAFKVDGRASKGLLKGRDWYIHSKARRPGSWRRMNKGGIKGYVIRAS